MSMLISKTETRKWETWMEKERAWFWFPVGKETRTHFTPGLGFYLHIYQSVETEKLWEVAVLL